jgi:hypothetical protein
MVKSKPVRQNEVERGVLLVRDLHHEPLVSSGRSRLTGVGLATNEFDE